MRVPKMLADRSVLPRLYVTAAVRCLGSLLRTADRSDFSFFVTIVSLRENKASCTRRSAYSFRGMVDCITCLNARGQVPRRTRVHLLVSGVP